MSEERDQLIIRRILMALDASRQSLGALETAADLAARLGAELAGLFVEDINLVRLAALPSSRQLLHWSEAEESLDLARLERELRVQAESARRALAAAAQRAHTPWSFRVARGEVKAEILMAALEGDLVALGRASRSLVSRSPLGSIGLAVAAGAERSLLFLQPRGPAAGPIVAIVDEPETGRPTLAAASGIAERCQCPLIVLIAAANAEEAHRLTDWARSQTDGSRVLVRFEQLHSAHPQHLSHVVRAERARLVALNAASSLPVRPTLEALLHETSSSVLLVR